MLVATGKSASGYLRPSAGVAETVSGRCFGAGYLGMQWAWPRQRASRRRVVHASPGRGRRSSALRASQALTGIPSAAAASTRASKSGGSDIDRLRPTAMRGPYYRFPTDRGGLPQGADSPSRVWPP